MKIVFVDTNVFLRYLLNDVPAQVKQADAVFETARKGLVTLKVCAITVFEIAFTLGRHYGLNKKEIIKCLKTVVNTPYLKVEEDEIFRGAIGLYEQENLDFVDCFLYIKAEESNGEVLSFDKDFKKLTKIT